MAWCFLTIVLYLPSFLFILCHLPGLMGLQFLLSLKQLSTQSCTFAILFDFQMLSCFKLKFCNVVYINIVYILRLFLVPFLSFVEVIFLTASSLLTPVSVMLLDWEITLHHHNRRSRIGLLNGPICPHVLEKWCFCTV